MVHHHLLLREPLEYVQGKLSRAGKRGSGHGYDDGNKAAKDTDACVARGVKRKKMFTAPAGVKVVRCWNLMEKDRTSNTADELSWSITTHGLFSSAPTTEEKIAHLPYGGYLTEIEFTLHEGKNRQIRRLLHRSKIRLRHLKRKSIGNLCLSDLRAGHCRWLTFAELQSLYTSTMPGTPIPTHSEGNEELAVETRTQLKD